MNDVKEERCLQDLQYSSIKTWVLDLLYVCSMDSVFTSTYKIGKK